MPDLRAVNPTHFGIAKFTTEIDFLPPPTKSSLSGTKFNFTDVSVQPNFWQERGRLHQALLTLRSDYQLTPSLW